jgi:hypothetical protein
MIYNFKFTFNMLADFYSWKQGMFNPLNPPYQGEVQFNIIPPLTRGARGVALSVGVHGYSLN